MGEGIEEDNSDVPDTTDDGQTGDGEDKKAPVTEKEEEQTPEGDESGDNQDASDENAAGSDEEPTDENKPADEATVSEEENSSSKESSNQILSLETKAETKIVIKGVAKNAENQDELADLSSAKIHFTDGCASEDGSEVRENTDITFRVLAEAGYKVDSVKFAAAEKEEDLTLAAATKSPTLNNGVYTIAKSEFTSNNKNTKSVLIVVKTVETQFTVKAGSIASGVTVNTIATAQNGDTSLAPIGSGKAFDYSEANAITLAMSGMAAGKTYTVTATAGGDPKELTAGSEAEVTGGTKYIPYTLNVSELGDDVEQYEDQEITITVREVADVTVAASPITKTDGYDATIAAPTIPAEGATGYVAYKTTGDYNAGDKVVFTITPAANSNWAEVTADNITAKLTSGEEETPLTVGTTVPEAITVAEGTTAYVVEIPTDVEDGYTLEIDVQAELGDKAKVIAFTKSGHPDADKVVTIMGGDASANAKIETASVKTMGNTYSIDIASREGYRLEKVNVKVTGTYDTDNAAYTDEYVLDEAENYGQEGHEDVESNYPRYEVEKAIALTGTKESKAWTASSVEIAIIVSENIEGADEEKRVTFGSGSEAFENPYAYEVTTFEQKDEDGNIIEKVAFDKEHEMATIAEGTQYLTFSVAAETEPQVELKLRGEEADPDESGFLELVSAAAGKFEYRVAAKALIGSEGHISITRLAKSLTATFEDNARVSYKNVENEENVRTKVLRDGEAANVDVNAPLEITVEPVQGKAPIASVTYKVGAEGAEQTAQADSEGKYVFSVKASDNVTVDVARVADERLFVVNGEEGAEEIAPDSVVEVDYENEISAYLLNADDTYISIINATVKDGTALAETKATIADDVATLKVAKNEYEKELTVTLLKADRTTVSFKVKSDKAVEEVISYTNAKGEAVTSASLNADTSLALRINAKDGNVNKLRAAVVATPAASATVPEKVPADTANGNDNITATLNNGTLTITAAALKDKVDAAGTILLYEVGDAEKTVLSSLNVSVNAPIMKGQTAAATAGLTDGRTVSVNITVPDEVKSESLEAGILGYEIKVTAPTLATAAPEGFTIEEWTATRNSMTANIGAGSEYAAGKFVSRGQINGGHTIRVLGNNVKPAKIDGIKILVTPVQYTDRYDRIDANKISGTAAAEIETGTTAPIYSDTLKLGKGANTLTTGQDADIVVAVPDFAKDAQYKRVNVEIIDSTTGMEHAEAWAFDANWDAVNGAVTVNAADASCYSNANGDYKNLAVKVTAFTEKGDYGVSGVKKLSVINGIEDINLSVQPEILATGKKVTVKSAITYNYETSDKKYAPKKKAVTYRIVGVDSDIDWENDYELIEAPLSAKLSATVDAKGTKAVSVDKTGKITVAAGYTPTNKWEENSFQLLAEAADYEGNPVKTLSGPITIIATDTVLNDLAVFEQGTNGWSNAKKVTGDLPVKTTSGQYRLAMLKPGTPEKVGYNLNTDTVDDTLLDIKSSNKGIELYAVWNGSTRKYDYGYINVKKLGKTNFTMAAKSNSKNKKELKNVNFVMENTDLYAEVTRYQDSTFKKAVDTKHFNAAGTIDVTGNTTGYFSVNIVKRTGEDTYTKFALPNYALSFKNAKKVTPVSSDRYEYTDDAYIVATGSTGKKATVITVNNKGVKPAKKFEITISNATADTLAGNAPKLALADKKQRILADGGYNDILVTVTAAKKGEVLPADTYVMLSADQTKKTKANVNHVFDGSLDTPILLNKTGDSTAVFNVGLSTNQAESYTLIATLGTMTDGVFTQTYKEARINLKAVKANINMKATAKYTLNPYGVSSTPLVINGGDYDVEYVNAPDADGNFAENLIQKDGTPNEFNKYFQATGIQHTRWVWDEDLQEDVEETFYVIDEIRINPNLSVTDLAKLEDKDFLKANTTGYISVTNGAKAMDVKLTITVKQQKDMKLKAVATPVIEGKEVITDIQIMNGKTPVALAQYTAEGGSFKAYYTTELAKVPAEAAAEAERLANGIIRVKAAEAKKGSDTVVLRVLPADTAANYRTLHAQNNPNPLKTYGTDVPSVKVTIAASTTANKVVVSNNDKKWTVARSDWNATNEFSGWSTWRPYTFKNRLSVAEGQEITVTSDTPYVIFGSNNYSADGRQELYIDLDKAKLTEAMAAPRSKVAWGKKVNVKATFSYLGTAEEGKDAPELLKSDSVTFAITLPEKEGFESADALNAAVEANKAALQNLVDKRTAEEHWNAQRNNNYSFSDAAHNVAYELKEAVLDMSKGTTAVITANGAYNVTTSVYTYNLAVAGKSYQFTVLAATPTANSVARWINNQYGTCAAEDAEALGLSFYPETTPDALAAKLRSILTKENMLTRNISISVTSVECEAPTTEDSGRLEAVVLVKDSNVEPHDEYSYTSNAKIRYTFATLTGTNTFKKGQTYGLDGKLTATVTGGSVSNMTQIFSDAYRTSNGDIKEHVIGEEMRKALIAGIEKFANTIVEEVGNPYLGVKGIDAESFACEWSAGDSAWKLAFEITYTDSTPDAEEKEFTVAIVAGDNITVAENAVPSFQTVAQLKNAAKAAFDAAYKLIKNVTTEDAAVAEIRSIIEKASLNPNYKPNDSLKIEVENFTAPTTDVNGMIDVKISYDATNSQDTSTNNNVPASFIIVKSDDLLGNETDEDGNETNTPNLGDHDRVKDLIAATLTPGKINKIVQDTWTTFAKTGARADFDAAKLTDAIKTVVTQCAAGTTVEPADATPVVAGTLKMPADSQDATGTLGAITITLKDDTTAFGAEEGNTVTIPATSLTKADCYQSEAEFRKAVKDSLTTNGIAYVDGWFEDGNIKAEDTETQNAIIGAITTEMKKAGYAKNPEFAKDAYVRKAEAVTTGDDADLTKYANKLISNVKVTIGSGSEAEDTINVKLCVEEEMSLIKSVKITKIGTTVPAEGKNGSSEDAAFEIANSEDDLSLDLDATVDSTNGATDEAEKLTWKLADKSGTDFNPDTEDGVQNKIKVEDSKLIIPKDAYAADGSVVVKLTAEAAGEATAKGKKAETLFVKIFLTEKVTGINLMDSTGKTAAPIRYEAYADEATTVTFKTALEGSHIVEGTTKAKITAPDENLPTGVTFTDNTGDTSQLIMNLATTVAGENEVVLTLEAGTEPNKKTGTAKITVVGNAKAKENITLGFNTEGMTDAEWTAGTPAGTDPVANPATNGVLVIKDTVENPAVIPVTISDATREWGVEDIEIAMKTDEGSQLGSADITDLLTFEKPLKGANRGSIVLKVNSNMPEILAKRNADTEHNITEVKPLVLTLTATSTADETKGQAAVKATLDFEIVVDKKITGITVEHDNTVTAENDYVDGLTVTKQSGEDGTAVTLKATVTGAHVSTTGNDQGVTWKITSKGARSKATISADGKVTIPEESVDNIIKVTATSKVDKTRSETISLKVVED